VGIQAVLLEELLKVRVGKAISPGQYFVDNGRQRDARVLRAGLSHQPNIQLAGGTQFYQFEAARL
jgi:hypothetical protein